MSNKNKNQKSFGSKKKSENNKVVKGLKNILVKRKDLLSVKNKKSTKNNNLIKKNKFILSKDFM